MSTAYILNCSFPLEDRDGVPGVTLTHGGVPFWFPYGKVTPVPNFTLREVDHAKSTPEKGAIGDLYYQNEFVDGLRLAQEFTEGQRPVQNKEKGIQIIEGKSTGESLIVFAGATADKGTPIMTEVLEKVATKAEIEKAEKAAETYEKQVIADYFDSKRQRMTGGQGRTNPDRITRLYMEKWNVEDNDDITAHQKNAGGMDYELIRLLMEESRKGAEVSAEKIHEAVEKVRRSGKAQLSANQTGKRRQSLGLAENKARYEAEHKEEAEPAQKVT